MKNFICFNVDGANTFKILAGYHQYFAVKKAIESTRHATVTDGKGGVFWHTQGSGKSFSMVFFARKVRRKISGNFTFLIITDREDLDDQIHKNFVKTEVIGQKEECQPKNGKQLRDYLQTNKSFIFTLIHKFRYDKGKKYPVLSTRDDIIVLVDEAHKMISQLSGEVMRRLNPACVIEFTATPVESNVLYRVFPSRLKAEEMVKLPFNVAEHPSWEEAVLRAVETRKTLAGLAAKDERYIRPLVLFQAEKKNQSCTVDKLKRFLLDHFNKRYLLVGCVGEDSLEMMNRLSRMRADLDFT